jgi:hypothetical protein
MKKTILLFLSVTIINFSVSSQYKINKHKYDYHSYRYQNGDKYQPPVAGITSFLIPGLGQAISGETLRGFAFFGSFLASITVLFIGENKGEKGVVPGTLGGIGCTIVPVWSAIDAVRVAKVNNLAFRDKTKTLYNFNFQPYINTELYSQTHIFQSGLTIKITF